MSSIKTLMTADELFKMPADGYRYELIEGELRKMSPGGGKHGAAIGRFTSYFGYYIHENGLGTVYGAETGYKIKTNPDTVIAPDVSFISNDRLHDTEVPDGYLSTIPNLIVEVLSPGDTKKEVKDKIALWLAFGVTIVITLNPRKREVSLYRHNCEPVILDENATLVLDDVVTGFSYPVSKFFLKINS